MLDHAAIQLAMRQRAITLSLATTGAITMSATATGYARTTGSFQADGFWPGMEIVASGFGTAANNVTSVVSYVTPLAITTSPVVVTTDAQGQQVVSRPATVVEGAGAGRTLTAGLPSFRAWENGSVLAKAAGVPYVEEGYAPGPSAQVTLGPLGEIEAEPMYILNVSLASSTGLTLARYGDALYRLFAPRTAVALPNGDVVRVRSDAAPTIGQLQQGEPGYAVKVFRAPLRIRTSNIL